MEHIRKKLRSAGIVKLPAIEHFDPAGCFYKALHNNDGVSIVALEPDFLEFMRAHGAPSTSIPPNTIHVQTIVQQVVGIEMVEMLRLHARPVHLAHIYELMKNQPKGQDGPLLVSRWPTSFVVGAANNARYVVRLRYFDKEKASVSAEAVPMAYPRSGWVVGLKSTESPNWARMGERIAFYD